MRCDRGPRARRWRCARRRRVGLLYLLLPLALIFLYAFTTDERSYTFPPPGLTTKWLAVAWGRPDVWAALGLSLRVAGSRRSSPSSSAPCARRR